MRPFVSLVVLLFGMFLVGTTATFADDHSAPKAAQKKQSQSDIEAMKKDRRESRGLVDAAAYSIEDMLESASMVRLHRTFPKAKAIMIFPSILRGGFIIGGQGGNGVLSVRRGDHGKEWSPPTFYTLGGASFGAQIGLHDSEVVFAIMTDRGLKSILSQRVKLGADVSVAAGPVGIGASASATATFADIYSYSMNKGLYVGLNIEGTYIHPRRDLNHAYYGRDLPVDTIIYRGKVRDSLSKKLEKALNTPIIDRDLAEPSASTLPSGERP